MATTRRFSSISELLRWRKNNPRRKIQSVSVTSSAPVPVYTKREWVVRLCHWGIANTGAIHYAEKRPIPLPHPHVLPKLPLTTDCSGWATICYRYAGASDPGGSGYNGQNFTGTFLKHMKHINIASVKAGDLVVYGVKSNPTGHHVAVVMNAGKHTPDTIVTCSHGSENGPLQITVSHEANYQPDGLSGVVYLTSIVP